jgi:hypothetical protein
MLRHSYRALGGLKSARSFKWLTNDCSFRPAYLVSFYTHSVDITKGGRGARSACLPLTNPAPLDLLSKRERERIAEEPDESSAFIQQLLAVVCPYALSPR